MNIAVYVANGTR